MVRVSTARLEDMISGKSWVPSFLGETRGVARPIRTLASTARYTALASDRFKGRIEQMRIDKRAVVTVGDARGFIIEHTQHRLVVTAAHCLPKLPPAHPASYNHERTWKLLAPLGEKPAVRTECLFVDPIADIAVLGS